MWNPQLCISSVTNPQICGFLVNSLPGRYQTFVHQVCPQRMFPSPLSICKFSLMGYLHMPTVADGPPNQISWWFSYSPLESDGQLSEKTIQLSGKQNPMSKTWKFEAPDAPNASKQRPKKRRKSPGKPFHASQKRRELSRESYYEHCRRARASRSAVCSQHVDDAPTVLKMVTIFWIHGIRIGFQLGGENSIPSLLNKMNKMF